MRQAQGSSTELLTPPFALSIPLELHRSSRARRLSIRIDMARSRVVLVTPRSVARSRALDFLIRNEAWLKSRLAQLPASKPFTDGATVPMLGVSHRVKGDATTLRGRVACADGVIVVPGAPEHLPRRLTEFLRAEAKREIGARARAKAETIRRRIKSIAIRDTRSRWGSCNAAGALGFSWRLILAPEFVLDYVVGHEVAHLIEMNHGPRFWKLCAKLTKNAEGARAWLAQHGPELHRYGGVA